MTIFGPAASGMPSLPRPQIINDKPPQSTDPRRNHPSPAPRRTPKGPITHDLDETRSQDIPWSLCGVLLYDPEADREGRRAGDLPEVPAVPVGGQLSETSGSDEGGEDLTGRRPSAPAVVAPGGTGHG